MRVHGIKALLRALSMRLNQNREPENGDFIKYVEELIASSPTAMQLKQRLKSGDLSEVFSTSEISINKIRIDQKNKLKALRHENETEARKIKEEAHSVQDFQRSSHAQDRLMSNQILNERKNSATRIKQEAKDLQSFAYRKSNNGSKQRSQSRGENYNYSNSRANGTATNQKQSQSGTSSNKKANKAVPFIIFGLFMFFIAVFSELEPLEIMLMFLFLMVGPFVSMIVNRAKNKK